LKFDAFFVHAGYWHTFVALRAVDGRQIVFSTRDEVLAPRFEVFSLVFSEENIEAKEWIALGGIFTVALAVPLWRNEWLEPMAAHQEDLSGQAPSFTHHAGSGEMASTTLARAKVQSAVWLSSAQDEHIVIAASNRAPFNIDIAVADYRHLLDGHFPPDQLP
jgi:hypothetical protein